MTTLHTTDARAVRTPGTTNYAYEDDAGDIAFGPLDPRTLLFGVNDDEALYATMSACPGGHEAVEEARVALTIVPID